ncbi:MAG TPA: cytochrome P450 [Microthrixaceae bacterium]|nr:cytochrome P450 [Microthrixaceae bacterium]
MTETGELKNSEADDLLISTILTTEGRQDPYGAYAKLRNGKPRWLSSTGSTVLAGYSDGLEALRNPKLGRPEDDMGDQPTISGRQRSLEGTTTSMLLLNPPDHTRIRSLVSRTFTPRRIESLRPTMQSLLDPILAEFGRNGGGDLIAGLAAEFPISVISLLLGVPTGETARIRPLVRSITSLIDSASDDAAIEKAHTDLAELIDFFVNLIDEKRKSPDDALLSALIEVEENGDKLSTEELIANAILLYSAGFETTSNLIGNGMWLLLRNPEQMSELRAHPDLMSSAIMEMLRADSPVQLNVRAVLEPVELFGEVRPRGDSFLILQGSGNLDESIYPDADKFDVRRFVSSDQAQPLSFGWGAHHCLGAHLARAEGEIVFSSLLNSFQNIELDTQTLGAAVPTYRPSFTLRGLESLPLQLS